MKNNKNNLQNKSRKGGTVMNLSSKKGFGINEVIGIAAGVIIAAVVVIPGLRTFAQSIMSELTTWWTSVSVELFV